MYKYYNRYAGISRELYDSWLPMMEKLTAEKKRKNVCMWRVSTNVGISMCVYTNYAYQ